MPIPYVTHEPTLGRFQSGLVYLNDRPKPSLSAFELPLALRSRSGGKVSLWGQERVPEAGAVTIQVFRGGWKALARPARSRAGYFTWRGALPKGTRIRAVASGIVGPALTLS